MVPVPSLRSLARDRIHSVDELDAVVPFLDDVYASAERCGILLDATTAEGGPSQSELNLAHRPDALRVADDTLLLKQVIRGAARRAGFAATFMAKPFPDVSGSGLHVHASLLDRDGRNAFDDGGPEGTATLHHAIAGLLAHMPNSAAPFAPHLNSWRRLRPSTHQRLAGAREPHDGRPRPWRARRRPPPRAPCGRCRRQPLRPDRHDPRRDARRHGTRRGAAPARHG